MEKLFKINQFYRVLLVNHQSARGQNLIPLFMLLNRKKINF